MKSMANILFVVKKEQQQPDIVQVAQNNQTIVFKCFLLFSEFRLKKKNLKPDFLDNGTIF